MVAADRQAAAGRAVVVIVGVVTEVGVAAMEVAKVARGEARVEVLKGAPWEVREVRVAQKVVEKEGAAMVVARVAVLVAAARVAVRVAAMEVVERVELPVETAGVASVAAKVAGLVGGIEPEQVSQSSLC